MVNTAINLSQLSLPQLLIDYVFPLFLFGLSAALIFLRPSSLLVLLAFAVPFSYMKNLQSGGMYYSPEVIILAYIFVLVINYCGKREVTIVDFGRFVIRDRLFVIVLPFFTFLVLSAFPYKSLSFVKEIVRWLEVFGVMIISRHVITEKKALTHILWALTIAGGLEGLIVIIEVIAGNPIYPERAVGTFGNPNPLAAYLALIIPVTLGMSLHFKGLKQQITLVSILVICGTAFWFTFSRGGWIALGLAWLGMVLFTKERKHLIAVSGGLGAAIAILIVSSHELHGGMQFSSRLAHTTGIRVRMETARVGVGIAQGNLLFGIGAGNFKSFVKNPPAKYVNQTRVLPPAVLMNDLHNLYVQVLVETGIFGGASFLFCLGWVLFHLLKGTLKMRERQDYALQLGLVVGVGSFAVNNILGVFFVHGMGLLWGMLIGLGFGLLKLNGVGTEDGEK